MGFHTERFNIRALKYAHVSKWKYGTGRVECIRATLSHRPTYVRSRLRRFVHLGDERDQVSGRVRRRLMRDGERLAWRFLGQTNPSIGYLNPAVVFVIRFPGFRYRRRSFSTAAASLNPSPTAGLSAPTAAATTAGAHRSRSPCCSLTSRTPPRSGSSATGWRYSCGGTFYLAT